MMMSKNRMNDTGLLNDNVFLDLQVWTESLSVAALNFVSGLYAISQKINVCSSVAHSVNCVQCIMEQKGREPTESL